jgi:hypothetical protein
VFRGRIVRVVCYYRDASLLEMIISTFRKLLIDIDWVYGRKVSDDGLYEVVLGVRDSRNFKAAVLDLSNTVNVEVVEVLGDSEGGNYITNEFINGNEVVKICIPKTDIKECYSWGEVCG